MAQPPTVYCTANLLVDRLHLDECCCARSANSLLCGGCKRQLTDPVSVDALALLAKSTSVMERLEEYHRKSAVSVAIWNKLWPIERDVLCNEFDVAVRVVREAVDEAVVGSSSASSSSTNKRLRICDRDDSDDLSGYPTRRLVDMLATKYGNDNIVKELARRFE